MFVNSEVKEIDPERDTTPIIKNGRTMVPIRAIVEALGGYVSWDEDEEKVTVLIGKIKLNCGLGSLLQ